MSEGWRQFFAAAVRRLKTIRVRRKERALQVQETVSLGEKRFVAVVQYEGLRFLVGGGAQSVSLLTALPGVIPFREVLARVQPEGVVR